MEPKADDDYYNEVCKESFENHPARLVFFLLRQGLHHVTSVSGFRGIRRDGCIRPNTGEFPYTFPQTATSYSLRERCVSLFDFETPTEDECIGEVFKWNGFFDRHRPASVLLRLSRTALADGLISNETVWEQEGFSCMWMPYIEAWYPAPVPWSAVTDCFLLIPFNDRVAVMRFGTGDEELKEFDLRVETIERIFANADRTEN